MPHAEHADVSADAPPDGARDGSALCRRCGLCCDGTLFGHVRLEPEAEARVRRRGLPIIMRDGKPALRQRCPAFGAEGQRAEGQRVEGLCTIYTERPRRCVGYRCKLLDRYEVGGVALPAASVVIARLRAMSTALRARLGEPEASLTQLRARIDEQDAASVAWRRDHAELLMDLACFQQLCDRDFLRPRVHNAQAPPSEH